MENVELGTVVQKLNIINQVDKKEVECRFMNVPEDQRFDNGKCFGFLSYGCSLFCGTGSATMKHKPLHHPQVETLLPPLHLHI